MTEVILLPSECLENLKIITTFKLYARNPETKFLGGFLLGTAIGAATGLLLAPNSGRKTRRKIKNESKQMAEDVIAKTNESLKTAKKAFDEKLDAYMKKGKSTVQPHLSEVMNGN